MENLLGELGLRARLAKGKCESLYERSSHYSFTRST